MASTEKVCRTTTFGSLLSLAFSDSGERARVFLPFETLPEVAQDTLFIKRFEKEARLAPQLEHPKIVSPCEYWRDAERAYPVMRWDLGGTFKEFQAKPWQGG